MSKNNQNQKVMSERLVAIWGNDILDDGFTTIPNMIVRYAKKAGLSGSEFYLVNLILTFKHDVNDPYPSQETLAELYGTTRQNIGNMLTRIFEKGLIDIYENFNEKGQFQNNVYSFEPLVEKCLELSRKDKEENTKSTMKKRKRGSKKEKTMQQKSGTEGQLFSGMDKQHFSGVDKQQKSGTEGQLFSGTKKTSENDKYKNDNYKNLSLYQDVPSELKKYIDSEFFRMREREIKGITIYEVLKRYNLLKDKVPIKDFIETLDRIIRVYDEVESFARLFQIVLEDIQSRDRNKGRANGLDNIQPRRALLHELQSYFGETDIYQFHVDQYIENHSIDDIEHLQELLNFKKRLHLNKEHAQTVKWLTEYNWLEA